MKFTLRTYQQQALSKIMWSKNANLPGNDLIVIPTGGGKSILIAELANTLNEPILVLQPTKEILEQNYGKLLQYISKEEIGIYSASMNEKTINRYTLATIQSIYRKPEFFQQFKTIILDEAHLLNPSNLAGMFTKFLKGIENPRVIGLTATPFRLANKYKAIEGGWYETISTTKLINRMKGFFWQRVLFNINIQELQEMGFLCPLQYVDMSVINHEDIPLNKTESNFDWDAYENKISQKQEKILKTILYAESISKGVLVFCSSVRQATKLTEIINNSAVITAKTPKKERERIVDSFRSGEIKTMFNVGVFNCLSDDTEILTKNNGWVDINTISSENSIAQYQNGKITFSKSIAIHKRKLQDDTMVGLNGRYVSVLVTKNHDLLIGKYKHVKNKNNAKPKKFKKIKAEAMIGKRCFLPVSGSASPEKLVVTQRPQPNRRIFLAANSFNYRKKGLSHTEAKKLALKMYEKKCQRKYKNPNELTIDECNLIGFWIGDGSKSIVKDGSTRYTLCQSLTNPKIILWIDNLLKNCNIDYSYKEYPSKGKVIINGYICKDGGHKNYLLPNGTGGHKQERNGLYKLMPYLEKKGTDLFWGLNRKQYFALMEGLWKADGWHGDNKNYFGGKIIGEHKKLFDLLQAIGVCRGFRVTIKPKKKTIFNKKQLYSLSLFDKRIHQLSNDRLKKIPYEKSRMVWCVTMPHGTIVTRRNGTVTIMGNCGFDYPELDCIVLLRPTRSIALHIQQIGRGLRVAEGKKFCRIFDLVSNVKNLGRIETIKLIKREKWELESESCQFPCSWHNKELYKFRFQRKPKKLV